MTQDKYDDLLERVKEGDVQPYEILEVAAELLKPQPDVDRYTLLYILGRGGRPAYKHLIEPYLAGPDDMLARLALWIVCWYWNLAHLYAPQLLRFIRGVHWDGLEQCRLAATEIAGDYLAKAADPDLLAELIRIFENPDESETLRLHAYSSLVQAVGRKWHPLPAHEEAFDLDASIDIAVIEEAKDRLSIERGTAPLIADPIMC